MDFKEVCFYTIFFFFFVFKIRVVQQLLMLTVAITRLISVHFLIFFFQYFQEQIYLYLCLKFG